MLRAPIGYRPIALLNELSGYWWSVRVSRPSGFLAASETTTLCSPTPRNLTVNYNTGAPGWTRTDEYEFTKLAL